MFIRMELTMGRQDLIVAPSARRTGQRSQLGQKTLRSRVFAYTVRRQVVGQKMRHRVPLGICGVDVALHSNFAQARGRDHFEMKRRFAEAAEPTGDERASRLRFSRSAPQRLRTIQRGMVRTALHLERKRNPVTFADDHIQRFRIEHAREASAIEQLLNDRGRTAFLAIQSDFRVR